MSKFQAHKDAPDEVWLQIGYGDEGEHTWAPHQVAEDDIEQAGPYVRADRLSGRVRVKPLDLWRQLEHAFRSGYRAKISGTEEHPAWAEYDPEDCASFPRILAALEPAPTPPAREKALREAAEIIHEEIDGLGMGPAVVALEKAAARILALIPTGGGDD